VYFFIKDFLLYKRVKIMFEKSRNINHFNLGLEAPYSNLGK